MSVFCLILYFLLLIGFIFSSVHHKQSLEQFGHIFSPQSQGKASGTGTAMTVHTACASIAPVSADRSCGDCASSCRAASPRATVVSPVA